MKVTVEETEIQDLLINEIRETASQS
jgi:hypothetical protein